MFFEMRQRLSQGGHIRQVKRHMPNRFRRRPAFGERDGDVLVAHGHTILELELLLQAERALKPFRAPLRIAHSQAEMAHDSESEWNFHKSRGRPFWARRFPNNDRKS